MSTMTPDRLEQHIDEVNAIIDETRERDGSDEVAILVAEVLRLRGLRQADAARVAAARRTSKRHDRYVQGLQREAAEALAWERRFESLLEVRVADEDACTCGALEPARRPVVAPYRAPERSRGLRAALAACGIPVGR